MTLTVDDRELIEELDRLLAGFAGENDLKVGPHMLAHGVEKARDRLQSLLSDRDKLEQLLERVWACRVNVQGRFINIEKLWPVIDDIGVVISQREVP